MHSSKTPRRGGREETRCLREKRAGRAAPAGAVGVLFKAGLTAGKIRPELDPFPVAPVGTAAGRWESGKSGLGFAAPGGRRCPVAPRLLELKDLSARSQPISRGFNEIRSSEAHLYAGALGRVLLLLLFFFFFPFSF